MFSAKVERDCLEARPYYYDFLVGLPRADDSHIPEGILRHIAVCRYCKSEIHRLKGMLEKKKTNLGDEEGLKLSCISDILSLHFSYLDSFVNCKDVKPFLPVMLIGQLGVRIPTPITAHIDHCSSCSEDIGTLKKLDLQDGQLIRFAYFLAKKSRAIRLGGRLWEDSANPPLADERWEGFRDTCHVTRDPGEGSQRADIESPKADGHLFKSEIFDFCFPYKAGLNERKYADFRESVNLHLKQCPKCLEKAEYMHKALYGIVARPDSGVATHSSVEEQSTPLDDRKRKVSNGVKGQYNRGSNALYADWPINVKVFGKAKRRAVSAFGELKGRMSLPLRINLRKYAKVALPAAAAILIAVALLINNIPQAEALDFQDVYQAFRGMENAKISVFLPGQKEPLRVRWLSKALDIELFRMDGKFTLWDFSGNTVKKTSSLSSGSTSKTAISEARNGKLRNMMVESLGLMPFAQRDKIPENFVWQRVSEDEVETAGANTEVYDFYWTSQGPNLILERWRYFIDPATDLPKRVEVSWRDSSEKDYTLSKFFVITHPDTEQIEKMIQDVFK